MTSLSNTRSRVKLYTLNDERQWDDRGTGYVTYVSATSSINNHSIIVKSEIDGSTLLESQILSHTKYQKQQETLIVWSEGENYDLALSFQEKLGCDDIWENICNVQGKENSGEGRSDSTIYESDDECPTDSNETYLTPHVHFPPVDRCHLTELCELLRPEKVRDASRRDLVARYIESENYIRQLLDLFHQCEQETDLHCLHQLFEIMRSIIYLNKSSLFEILFQDDVLWDVIGCLEYEPMLNGENKRNHREFLKQKATFKEVIPIGNQNLLAKIHQTYRVQYIQDAILPAPSLFEENLLSTMNTFLYMNKVEIVTLLYENPKFLNQLFSTLRDEHLSDEQRKDLMLFLKEFCVFSQTLQQRNRDQFFQALATHGILNVIQMMLNLDDTTTKQAALDVFASIVECNPSTVREYMLQETQSIQDDDELLLNLVLIEIRADPDPELSNALHLMNQLKLLIDPDNMLAVSISEKTEFLSFFYFRSMSVLLAPIMNNTNTDQLKRDDFHHAQLENLIVDFLTFCLEHHTYHMKNFLNRKDFLRRLLVLLKSKHQFLQLSALRFFRKLIAFKDEQYYMLIVRNNFLAPIVNAFKANKRRYNLFNSALIEFFEYIRQEDIHSLINYFIDNFYGDFQSINYVKTFQALKSRYDAYRNEKERIICRTSPISSTSHYETDFSSATTTNSNTHLFSIDRFRKDQRDLDVDEENWFNLDHDEQPSSSTQSNPLFNSISDDDDDDDNNNNNNDDDDDDDDEQTTETSATATTSQAPPPPRTRSASTDDDNDEEEQFPLTTPCSQSKSVINIHIRSTSTGESSSPYPKSPALSNIADQYSDDDEEEEEEEENLQTTISRKRSVDHIDDTDDNRQKKICLTADNDDEQS